MKRILFLSGFLICFTACKLQKPADLVIYNAHIYTVDKSFVKAEAMAVLNGRILETGSTRDITDRYMAKEKLDMKGAWIYPGFIDAHCHFYAYGQGLHRLDLTGTHSYEEILQRVKDFAGKDTSGWIIGRGWDQNDWPVKEYPTRTRLDSLFPNRPVMLKRVDGHAALVNGEALRLAGITANTRVEGGKVVLMKDKRMADMEITEEAAIKTGYISPSGVLIDNAVDLVAEIIPKPSKEDIKQYLLDAQKKCFEVGLTTVDDAGLDKEIVETMDELQKAGKLQMRIYAMLNPTDENFEKFLKAGPLKNERLNVCSFKFYADGALGSRGACLLQPYTDRPKETGFLLHPVGYYEEMAIKLASSHFQMNTHCIGDSANRFILKLYAKVLQDTGNDRRWRIEHAQVVHPADQPLFGKYKIIPSVQPTHATSDMYWAADRLGPYRVKYAYAYLDLFRQNGMLAAGSDFPVESINPLFGFYAAVSRQDQKGFPPNGFQKENALSREQALRSMTTWAAFSNFEEMEKGSLEAGKWADFVVLNEDLMNLSEDKIFMVRPKETWIGGIKVYSRQ